MIILQPHAVKNRQEKGDHAVIYIAREAGELNLNYNFVSDSASYKKGIERSLKRNSILNRLILFKRSTEKEIKDLVDGKTQIGFMNGKVYFLIEIKEKQHVNPSNFFKYE